MTRGSTAIVDGVAKANPQQAWNLTHTIDPTKVYPKFGPLPAVVEVRNQTGSWDVVGRTRQLLLSDGGSVVEHIIRADEPEVLAYRLSDFQKLFGKLVSGANAEWAFTPVAGGTRIRWTYTFHPLPRRGIIVGVIVRLFWGPYMKRVLPTIIAEVNRLA
jgi:hypothetical protein